MIFGIDFDGTIVEHEYPNIGAAVPHAIETLRMLTDRGHQLILWTMRSGDKLQEAVDYLMERNIPLLGINQNPSQHEWTKSPKAYCHRYIDDAAVGCPLIYPPGRRPYVDWAKIITCVNLFEFKGPDNV